MTTRNMRSPDWTIASVFAETTAATTPTMPITDTSGNTAMPFSMRSPARYLTTSPKMTGTRTIWTMDTNRSMKDTGSHALASSSVSAGVSTGASTVDNAVAVTDSAVFPFARYVMTLEDVPPGAHPTRITPTAISGGSWNSMTSPSAMTGMIVYWAMTTIKTIFGAFNTLLKSPGFNVSPIPNIMIPRSRLM